MGFNYAYRSRMGGRDAGDPVTRGYLDASVTFYITTGVTILFLHNRFAFLTTGDVRLGDNHTARVIRAVVDTVLPIILGIPGCRLWRESSGA